MLSVTLKLADEDAAVIGSILKAVSMTPGNPERGNKFEGWYMSIRASHTNRELSKILELAGAFRVAVRANER